MDSTINCTRVPCSQATLQIGTPVELGLAPANLGPESDPVSNETNDEAVLNQSWQAASDAGHDERPTTTTLHENTTDTTTKPNQLLKCTRSSIFITFNVQTLGPTGRLEELVEYSK